MIEGVALATVLPQRVGKGRPRPHIGSRFQETPEMTGKFFETMWSERLFAGCHSPLVQG